MRTINVKAGMSSTLSTTVVGDFSDDRQPCWYANMETADKKSDYKWKVGCKHDGNTDEYSFKINKVGNLSDPSVWDRVTGVDFAIDLIDVFRDGGTKAVRDWIKNGCP